jgi:aspartyl-tRNA(Asn)/glutamyl-tRNA(Gln) amidotransferase subunit C
MAIFRGEWYYTPHTITMKKEDIEHLALLARIELRPGEAEVYADEITNILGYVSEVEELTGSDTVVKEVGPVHNVFREDSNPHEPGIYTEDILAAAPLRKGQYIEVKKILGES